MDSKKIRNSKMDIVRDREINKIKGQEIGVKADELVMDKDELDKVKEFIESMDMPEEEQAEALARVAEQQRQLEKTFEADVELPQDKLDDESDRLIDETSDLRKAADKNQQKLEGFRKQSAMDDSPIKQAAREQAEAKVFYEGEQRAISDLMRKQQQYKEEAKRKVKRVE